MIEPRRQLHYAREIVDRLLPHQMGVRNLQRNVNALKRIKRAEHRGKCADRQLREQSILAKFLSRAKHVDPSISYEPSAAKPICRLLLR